MPDHLIDELRRAAPLQSPARNRFFYGKLLDQFHLSMEQRYFNDKRWLVNRLSLGEGVLCGLQVAASRDRTRVLVGPGVAIDGIGREIIVPVESQPIDPRQPTDDCCDPVGKTLEGAGVVTICLSYLECETEPVAALVCGCETEQGCEHGTIRERYCIRVVKGAHKPPGIDERACAALTAARSRDKRRREQLCVALSGKCADAKADCVTLATVELKADGTIDVIDNCGPRVTLYSNAVLLDLILCLADRLDECCGGHVPVAVKQIAKVSGDPQVAAAGTVLPAPFVVRVFDQNGPVVGEAVTFQVASGGGAFAGAANATVNTIAGGLATSPAFTLGANAGQNVVQASIAAGNPSSVSFATTGTQIPARTPPKILRIWPRPGDVLDISGASPQVLAVLQKWGRAPWIEVTFDRAMDNATRIATKNWLRVGLLEREGSGGNVVASVRPIPNTDRGVEPVPQLQGVGVTYRFGLTTTLLGSQLDSRLFVVLARAMNGNILEAAPGGGVQPLMLDAEFSSVPFSGATVTYDEFWKLIDPAGPQSPSDHRLGVLATQLVAPAAQIPAVGTGNGVEGGEFSSWFQIGKL